MALVSSIELLKAELVIYNVHLESRGNDDLRCSQISEIFTDVFQRHSGMPVIVAGDFNVDLSRGKSAAIVRKALFANHFSCTCARPTTAPTRTRNAQAIDWVLSRGSLGANDVRLHDSVLASDHYPLSVVLRLDDCHASEEP